MKNPSKFALSAAQRKPLAACVAALFALAAPEAFASIVTSCADDGTSGTLRSAVASTASGDTVDMSGLTCSSITLSTGELAVTQASLTLKGPRLGFNIYGNIYHSGSGTLTVQDLTVSNGTGHHIPANPPGTLYGSVFGGCIESQGNVLMSNAGVIFCSADADTTKNYQAARGGGVFANGNLTMLNSYIGYSNVDATANATELILGGGACVQGNFIAKYSTVNGNQAGSTLGAHGTNVVAGGLMVVGNASIYESAIVRNTSAYQTGGIQVDGLGGSSGPLTITNSTISGNDAPKAGGLFTYKSANISNSTIAFNTKHAVSGNSAGATFATFASSTTINLHSTLIANNTYTIGGVVHDNDVSIVNSGSYKVTFPTDAQQGNFNLIRALDVTVSASSLPPDTIIGRCPMLGALKYNGGPTMTHALYSGSPAIDAGVNALGLAYDQRGGPQPVPSPIPPPPLAYERHSGVRTDIGAFEVQQTDIIFNSGFEGCP